jgi:hypothetical protein
MQKQHIKHFSTVEKVVTATGNKEYAVKYLQSMLRSAMSKKAIKEIQTEIAKYL